MIVTVRGEIPDERLGPTLAHEHLCCDISVHSGNPDNTITDRRLVADELGWFRRAGGSSIVEMTSIGIGRDPEALRWISEASGVHVVSGISFYQQETYPEWVACASVDGIADYFVRQIEDGENGVRAGLLGEITSHNEDHADASAYRLHDLEAKVFRAATRAQRRTGAAISTHASLGRGGHVQLNVLEDAGVDPSRVAIGHCDALAHADEEIDMAYYLPILERGAYVQFDLIGWNEGWPGIMSDDSRAERLASLIAMGHGDKLLISTDTCRLSQLHAHGGRGYDYVWREFLPLLRDAGIADEEIERILVDNPRRFIAIR